MPIVRIPSLTRSEQALPLQRCLEQASRETGVSQHTVALVMSHFLERLADEVSLGRVVRIPGFGMFAPKYYPGSESIAPKFSASRGFRVQVSETAPHTMEGARALENHARLRSSASKQQRVYTAQAFFRDRIKKQIAENGEE
jgi:nucleoid DNA-binding protein